MSLETSTDRPAGAAATPVTDVYRRLIAIAVQLAALLAVWWFLNIDRMLVGAIAAVIVVSGLVPTRFADLVWGTGMVGVAALVYFYFGSRPVAALLLIFGLFRIGMGVSRVRAEGARTAG